MGGKADGYPTWQGTYYPYGAEYVASSTTDNTATVNHYKFTGKERDAESGLDYFGARYLSSSMGRFMSEDPGPFDLVAPQTLNRYTYVSNNPLRFNDPTGKVQNPVTGKPGIDVATQRGTSGHIRSSPGNPRIGAFHNIRHDPGGHPHNHDGIDVNARLGTPLHAPISGTISQDRTNPTGYGLRVTITGDDGTKVSLAHLLSVDHMALSGHRVIEGQRVGFAGNDGNARTNDITQEHTHMRVVDSDKHSIDPTTFINSHPFTVDINQADDNLREAATNKIMSGWETTTAQPILK